MKKSLTETSPERTPYNIIKEFLKWGPQLSLKISDYQCLMKQLVQGRRKDVAQGYMSPQYFD